MSELDSGLMALQKEVGHTPGPWRMHDMERATVVAGRPGGEVANCLNGFGDQDANARLISAAPDLLTALQELYAMVKGECPALLDEDRGGNERLDASILAAFAKAGAK